MSKNPGWEESYPIDCGGKTDSNFSPKTKEQKRLEALKKFVLAIKDAKEYLDNVADDRDVAFITYERQGEVSKILEEFLIENEGDLS